MLRGVEPILKRFIARALPCADMVSALLLRSSNPFFDGVGRGFRGYLRVLWFSWGDAGWSCDNL